ncbi:RtcB family protein [Candidatus Woesearchaeota archaeon]|nr:RtcB family protein [Candidatus Woesearchaeota archaeon]
MVPSELKKISDVVWELPRHWKGKDMLVPARFIANDALIKNMDDGVFEQATNAACLPGIVEHALCMPDAHWGYGFPVGGVAAFDAESGIISPGAIGFDINCGMSLQVTNLTAKDVMPKIKELMDLLFKRVPSGVGSKGFLSLSQQDFKRVMLEGAKWCVRNGYAWDEDLERIEANGRIQQADPSCVTDKAISRGINQLGTLGSGNHYLEVQLAKSSMIFDTRIAKKFGIIHGDQVVIMVHCGSRGFGHQVATDNIKEFIEAMKVYKIKVNDRELACAPFNSKEGQKYYKAMACAANSAFANRQIIRHRIRECFAEIFKTSAEKLGMHLVYDVAHNIAKIEEHVVNGKKTSLIVHRKGATRAFPPGHPELANIFQSTGQPVIIGGSMETGSYLLVGTEGSMKNTFGSTAHGSGRTMSRTKAKNLVKGEKLLKSMLERGIYVKTGSYSGVAEEAGMAYKNISEVVDTTEKAGISKKIVGLVPIGNIKG